MGPSDTDPTDADDHRDPADAGRPSDPTDKSAVTVRASKRALRDAREVRLAQALRDNLARRKGQIRARAADAAGGGVNSTDRTGDKTGD